MQLTRILSALALLSALSPVSSAAPAADDEAAGIENATDRTSYALGYQMGRDLKQQKLTLDREAVLRGLNDGQAGAEPLLEPEVMSALLAELKQRLVRDMAERRRGESDAKRQAGADFLEANRSKPGVQTTASGLQYKVIRQGEGEPPGPSDRVRVHYRGRTIEGVEFDSSHRRGKPAEFALNAVIKGWGEGLQLMRPGAKYELYIPYQLAYGRRGPLGLQALVFEVELLAVNPASTETAGSGATGQ